SGGYHHDAWRLLAQTALVLGGKVWSRVPRRDPLRLHFEEVASEFRVEALTSETLLTQSEMDEAMGHATSQPTFLGFYTAEGIEYALEAYGLLAQMRRLG